MGAKAAGRTLMKLTPVVNFINFKSSNFTYESLFLVACFGFEQTFVQKNAHVKR